MATTSSLAHWLAATAALLALCSVVLTPTSAEAAILTPTSARVAQQPTHDTLADQFLRAHNQARKSVGASPLAWSQDLVEQAEKMIAKHPQANTASCQFFDNKSPSLYEVNQAVGNVTETPMKAIGKWVDGRRFYNSHDKSCAAKHEEACGAYKRVVSQKMRKLGCARTHCGRDGILTICLYSRHQNTHYMSRRLPSQSSQVKKFLVAHNEARESAGVNPLTWSMKLEERASKMAAKQRQAGLSTASCPLFDNAKLRKYWANQAVGNFMKKPATVVEKWVYGSRYYNHASKSCSSTENKDACEAYERVVLEKTTELGCAIAQCGKDESLAICLYSPGGEVHSNDLN